MLEAGITTLRDPSGDARVLAYLARQARTGAMVAPDIFYGALIGGPGFSEYGPVAGASEGYAPGTAPWAREVGDTTDLARVMVEASAVGATGVKMYRYLPADLTRRVVQAAHREGLLAWSHTRIRGHNGTGEPSSSPGEVVSAGADVISHASHFACQVLPCSSGTERSHAVATVPPDHPEIVAVLEEMARRGTILDPTLSVEAEQAEPHWRAFTGAVTALAHRLGVPIMAGPDRPVDPDASTPILIQELQLLVTDAGLSPGEALVAATATAARAIGQGESRGMLAPGMRADLAVLARDPSQDIRHLLEPALVVKGGVVVHRGASEPAGT